MKGKNSVKPKTTAYVKWGWIHPIHLFLHNLKHISNKICTRKLTIWLHDRGPQHEGSSVEISPQQRGAASIYSYLIFQFHVLLPSL